MNILILGAGTVGTYLAEALLGEGHSVVVIDRHRARVAEVAERLDVQAITGAATDHSLLERHGIREMDVSLSMTDVDEINLVSALTCKRLGVKRTVARVRNPSYLNSPLIPYRALFEVDLLISPELQTALEIVKFLENPDAVALEDFAHGRVQMRQLDLTAPCPVLGKPLAEADFPEGVLVAAIKREAEVMIPSGQDRLHLDDSVTLIGHPEALVQSDPIFGQTTREPTSVVIMGGGEVGYHLASQLETRPCNVMLIERDAERSRELSEGLARTTVICGDATKINVLQEERVGSAEVFIATSGEDEDNIMATQLAREMGVRQSIVLVHRPDYASVIQRMGFDHVLSPRVVTAKFLLAHIRERDVRSTSVLHAGAEIMEFRAAARSKSIGRPLRDIRLPRGTLICAIVHAGEMRVAHGDDVIEAV
jgi:trk system potassium uptake protein TrkA